MIDILFWMIGRSVAEADNVDPLRNLDRTRPKPLAYVTDDLKAELREHLLYGRKRQALTTVRSAMNWDQTDAEDYLQELQFGRTAKDKQ